MTTSEDLLRDAQLCEDFLATEEWERQNDVDIWPGARDEERYPRWMEAPDAYLDMAYEDQFLVPGIDYD